MKPEYSGAIVKRLCLGHAITVTLLILALSGVPRAGTIGADDPCIQYWGRVDRSDPAHVKFSWTRIMIVTVFRGTSVSMLMEDGCSDYDIEIDGTVVKTVVAESGTTEYELAAGLSDGEHLLRIMKRGEHTIEHVGGELSFDYSHATFSGLILDEGKKLCSPPPKPDRRIEFIGDSYTVAMGVESPTTDCTTKLRRQYTNSNESYAVIVADACEAEPMLLAISAHGVVHNYGDHDQNSEKPVPYFYPRVLFDDDIMWDFTQWVPHVVVVELGTNDFSEFQTKSYGAPVADPAEYRNGVQDLIDGAFSNYPDLEAMIFIATDTDTSDSAGPTDNNTGQVVCENQDKPVYVINFPEIDFNGCDYHPDRIAQEIIAETVLGKINEVVDWNFVVDAHKTDRTTQGHAVAAQNARIMYAEPASAAGILRRFPGSTLYNLNGRKVAAFIPAQNTGVRQLSRLSRGIYVAQPAGDIAATDSPGF
jgi:hypothetical protein